MVVAGLQRRLLQIVACGCGQQTHTPRDDCAQVLPAGHHASPSGHTTAVAGGGTTGGGGGGDVMFRSLLQSEPAQSALQ